jgi:hypothetical protein
MPAADRGVEEILECSAWSGTDDRRRWWIEMPEGVDDRLGTKAAQGEDQKDNLHPCPEGLEPDAGATVTVSPAKRQRNHHRRDDRSQYHLEMP